MADGLHQALEMSTQLKYDETHLVELITKYIQDNSLQKDLSNYCITHITMHFSRKTLLLLRSVLTTDFSRVHFSENVSFTIANDMVRAWSALNCLHLSKAFYL